MTNILIAGCGYIGTHLGISLAQQGHRVWGLRSHPEHLPEPIIPWKANLNDPASLTPPPADFDHVFYTAGARGASEADYQAAYVDGTRNLLNALQGQATLPKRIFFTSSTAVYEQEQGEWVDETTPVAPTRHTGRILLEAEQLFCNRPIPATIVRLGGIYGPGRTRLLDMVRNGAATVVPDRPQYLNLIHRDDVAGALAHLMALPDPDPLYLAIDNTPMDRTVLLRWMARQLGVAAPAVVAAADAPPLIRGGNRRCSNQRLREAGYVFKYPDTKDGYCSLLDV